ncbi:MAG: hypothetical protein KDB16_02360 [Acidimicrobiales bacterium]|nr:hypothetical protein [Acidimicrobiales bacterium]
MNTSPQQHPDISAEADVDLDAAPDVALLERIEGEMMRVEATLGALGAGDADPVALTGWIAESD